MRSSYLHLPLLQGFLIISSCFLFLTRLSLQAYNPLPPFPNPRLQNAFIALQAFKHSIIQDPKSRTSNWYGPEVCNYTGVFCAPAPDDPHEITVAGIDLNHGDITGTLPEDLGLLTDLALFHINSNQFFGMIPETFCGLKLLFELDVSNNRFSGPFPVVVLLLPSLKFLDIRFNEFDGMVPDRLFDLKLDAIFINDNKFKFTLPENIGNSSVSALVMANLQIGGCLPRSLGKMAKTLNQIILLNSGISGCLPPEIGTLNKLTVFDVSFNKLAGPLPETMGNMKSLEQLDVAHNQLSGDIPESICELPRLKNFTYSYNFFCREPKKCLNIQRKDDRKNCIPGQPAQRPEEECKAFLSKPLHCEAFGRLPPLPPPMTPPPPPLPQVYN